MRSLPFLPAILLAGVLTTGCADGSTPTETEAPGVASVASAPQALTSQVLVSGLTELQGSTVGPGGALFVTAPLSGQILRVDPVTGAVSVFASGLPARNPDPFFVGSGVVDVAFLDGVAYALVTGVAEDLGGSDIVGLYRIDGPTSHTIIADIGAYSAANLPATEIFIPSGYQFALETFRGGFLVSDGHHNRVLRVSATGEIRQMIAFGNVAPTGLEVSGSTIYLTHAGPIPHVPADGRIVSFGADGLPATPIASGAPLLVDVEFGRGRTLFALAQGNWDGPFEGAPALPNTGSLVRVQEDGTLTPVAQGLDRPVSMEIIGNTAYVVTLAGEIVKLGELAGPPFGR